MMLKSRHLFLSMVLIALAVGNAYQYIENRRLAAIHEETAGVIAGALGRLAPLILVAKQNKGVQTVENSDRLKLVVAPLALVLTSSSVEIENLNEDSFAGLCLLVANADNIFSGQVGNEVERAMDRVLNKRLKEMEARIRNESAARSLRIGDNHDCALTKRERAAPHGQR